MTDQDRREFLKKSAAAAAALGIPGAAVAAGGGAERAAAGRAAAAAAHQTTSLPAETLGAVGAAVLPAGELGADGISRVVADFEAWIDGFESQAELPHGYLNRGLAEIRYGPEHPGPRWAAQLEELEREAEQRHERAFHDLPVARQRELIEEQLDVDELDRLPSPARARHVAMGLMAHFYNSAEATDLCYRARIGRYRCRGLDRLEREPRPLAAEPSPATSAGGDKPRTPGRRVDPALRAGSRGKRRATRSGDA